MEDLPPNLDDGELWIPSDIFPADEPLHHYHRRHPLPSFHHHHHLHRPTFSPKPPSLPQGLEVAGPMKQYALTVPSPNGCYPLNLGPTVDHGLTSTCYYDYEQCDYPLHCRIHPLHKPHLHQSATKHEPLMATSNGSTMQQCSRHETPLFPFQATGLGLGSLLKECRATANGRRSCSGTTAGTGVFIPRVPASHKFSTGKTKLGQAPQRGSNRKVGMVKAEEYYSYDIQFPSDVILPKDWSY